MRKGVITIAAVLSAIAIPAQAETLRIEGIYPAGSEAAIEVESIALDAFTGSDGLALASVIADRLRGVEIGGEEWFSVLPPALAGEADSILTGHAEPVFSEREVRARRSVCVAKDEDGDCTAREMLEVDCVDITASFRPDLRLIDRDGDQLWSSNMGRSHNVTYCPDHDAAPDFAPIVDNWILELAAHLRHELAPVARSQDIRIMEGRGGLERAMRRQFRDAIRLTETDERAACEAMEELHAAHPEQPSLRFNTGLCAEQGGAFVLAEEHYRQALLNDRSDDEAEAGLRRLEQRHRASQQVDRRRAFLIERYYAENPVDPDAQIPVGLRPWRRDEAQP
ncbi:hypothetical protein [Aurantiacibacter gangjinensis]|uniref:Uncharacterized protein n=1 Tax=Aurantiacibacter gangjinensis TaxID=502682 RepID=A0A0G9MQS5_9SPHN|nr:hypothetical protein [Aurantiacibacter gangjinensis]APE28977.1 hypothetical protein BMF35_a2148 [Aurantiacibacter gangjinensis]KLE33092.1 hypothetical protein AAW01_03625 [Aurantiacibacter gangjinensis]